jgi:hypothetical protein
MRIGFDIGGVLSKYPEILSPLLEVLHWYGEKEFEVEVWFISDMHPVDKIIDMLELNRIAFHKHRVRSADYAKHGEMCKSILCVDLGIDILIDDFPGYVGMVGQPPLRLLVMPDATQSYYADSWKTDRSEGNFGRRRKS